MRDIKFRIWDLDFKTMRYHAAVGFDLSKGTKFDFGLLGGHNPGIPERGFEAYAGRWQSEKDFTYFPLMQYTGLKDKNGKEIWEGDIVSFAGLWVVSYEEDRFLVTNGHSATRISTMQEVVGNIYENPELLK